MTAPEDSALSNDPDLTAAPRGDRLFVATITLLVAILTSIPYAFEIIMAKGRWVPLVGHSVSDHAVYLTSMQLARQGFLRDPHLYAGVHRPGILLYPTYIALGRLSALFHLPVPIAYHVGRLLLCCLFVSTCWWFITIVVSDRATQRLSLLLVCFSSGLGWLPSVDSVAPPIDAWQPEAITFLALYLYPHFIVALMLLLIAYGCILRAERSGDMRYAVAAGLGLMGLAITHTFDVVACAVVFTLYLVVRIVSCALGWYRPEPFPVRASLRALTIASAVGFPGLLFIVIEYRFDTIFSGKSHLEVMSGPLTIAQGYGLLSVAALLAIGYLFSRRNDPEPEGCNGPLGLRDSYCGLWLACWAAGTLGAVYLPVEFQRRLIEGAHIPIAILSALAIGKLLARYVPRPRQRLIGAPAILVTALLSISLIQFEARDMHSIATNKFDQYRTYLEPGEVAALQWAGRHTPKNRSLQPIPWMAATSGNSGYIDDLTTLMYAPLLTDRSIYAGHKSETDDNDRKVNALMAAIMGAGQEPARLELLREANIRYLIFSGKHDPTGVAAKAFPCFTGRAPVPPYLKLVYSNADADVYQVAFM